MSHTSIDDYYKRPIFLHAVNRELYESVGIAVDDAQLLRSIRLFSLISSQSIFCNISQIYAVFFDHPEAQREIASLTKSSRFTAHADYGSVDEFRESRAEKFDHAKGRHPAFFLKPSPELLALPLSSMGMSAGTTTFIENQLNGLIEDRINFLRKTLAPDDQNMIIQSEDWLNQTLKDREHKALTFDIFEQSAKATRSSSAVGAVRRALSQAYIGSYSEQFSSLCIWGYSGINRFDRLELLTGLNLRFAECIFKTTGLDRFLLSEPDYGLYFRTRSFESEALGLFHHRYYELASSLDNNKDTTAGYFKRNSEISESIQKILQAGTLSPVRDAHNFNDLLLNASMALEKTRVKLLDVDRPINSPKLYDLYPPIGDVRPLSGRPEHNERIAVVKGQISTKNPNLTYEFATVLIPFILGIAIFAVAWFKFEFNGLNATIAALSVGFPILALFVWFHPNFYYRRISYFGLAVCGFGSMSFQLHVEGVEGLGNSALQFGSGTSIGTMIVGFLIFCVGTFFDFWKNTNETAN